MKLKNKLAIITATAMLAFAGAGFAAWTFTQERSAEVDITDKVSVGIELNDDFLLYNASGNAQVDELFLICDAPAGESFVLDGQGAYWATDAAGANAITNVYMKGSLAKADEDGILDKANVTVSFEASHSLSSAYVSFGAFAAISNKVVAVSDGAEVKSDNFALPTLSYLDAPENISELTAMRTALASELASAVLSFSAQIVA